MPKPVSRTITTFPQSSVAITIPSSHDNDEPHRHPPDVPCSAASPTQNLLRNPTVGMRSSAMVPACRGSSAAEHPGGALVPSCNRRRGSDTRESSNDDDDSGLDRMLPSTPQASSPMVSKHPLWRTRHWPRGVGSLLAVVGLALVVLGSMMVCFFVRSPERKGCDLFYLYPVYIKQTGLDVHRSRFAQKYTLYLYREGGVDDLLDEPFRIPVLFIPGHAGSYKQVRSLASVTARKFEQDRTQFPRQVYEQGNIGFDFFTLDLNEEFTALHGYSLLEQAEFVNDAIDYILSLYPETRAKYRRLLDPSDQGTVPWALPQSVVVIGHSMGGVVARTAVTLANHRPFSINTIITLASPHMAPPAALESYVGQLYEQNNNFWINQFNTPNNVSLLADMSIVSIAGGNLDSMVSSDLAFIDTSVPAHHGFTAFTTQIPGVWLSMDHLSILWCRQMVDILSYTLTSIVDAHRPGQTKPLPQRMHALRWWLTTDLDTLDTEYHWPYPTSDPSSDDIDTISAPSPQVDKGPSDVVYVELPEKHSPAYKHIWGTVLPDQPVYFPPDTHVSPIFQDSDRITLTSRTLPDSQRTPLDESIIYLFSIQKSKDGLRLDHPPVQWEFMTGRSFMTNDVDMVLCRTEPSPAEQFPWSQGLHSPREDTHPTADNPLRWADLTGQIHSCRSVSAAATRLPAFLYPEPAAHQRHSYQYLTIPPAVLDEFDLVALYYTPQPHDRRSLYSHLDFLVGQRYTLPLAPGDHESVLTEPEFHAEHHAKVSLAQLLVSSLTTGYQINGIRTAGKLRTVVQLELPDNPLFAYRMHVQSDAPALPADAEPANLETAAPLFPLLVQQADSSAGDGRIWYNPQQVSLNFHRRGPYIPTMELESRTATGGLDGIHQWSGLRLTLINDPTVAYQYSVTLSLDLGGTMARLFKRYDITLLGFLTVYCLLVWKSQWRLWNEQGQFVSFSRALAYIIRHQFLWVTGGLVAMSWAQSELLRYLADQKSHYTLFATVSNLLLGYRGEGTWLVLLLLSATSLGVLTILWAACSILVYGLSLFHRLWRQRGRLTYYLRSMRYVMPWTWWWKSQTVPSVYTSHHGTPGKGDVISSEYNLALSGQPTGSPHAIPAIRDLWGTPRKVISALAVLLMVKVFMPYQFLYSTLWVVQLFNCVKTRTELACLQTLDSVQALSPLERKARAKRRTSDIDDGTRGTLPDGQATLEYSLDAQQVTHKSQAIASSRAAQTNSSTTLSFPALITVEPVEPNGKIPQPSPHGDELGTQTLYLYQRVLEHQLYYQMTVLIFMFLLLPYNAAEIIVWIRNLSVHWTEDASSDHSLWWIAPFYLMVKFNASFMLPRFVGGLVKDPSKNGYGLTDLSQRQSAHCDPTLEAHPHVPDSPRAMSSLKRLWAMVVSQGGLENSNGGLSSPTKSLSNTSMESLDTVSSPATQEPRQAWNWVAQSWLAMLTHWAFNLYIVLILLWGFQRAYYLYAWGNALVMWCVVLYVLQSQAVLRVKQFLVTHVLRVKNN
ncbi:GPI inositol deacylase [Dispira parvispora]|uniref:GPI inositol-deacylase n=1 Tax=Dispira parvispora TaxID=1520584 RepID=A0A9W8ARR4_9FUNG|nr:GPI inositol deacylase [Dispira parvispora]